MLGLIYSLISYVGFLVVYAYFAAFSAGLVVTKHVDSGVATSAGVAASINLGLMLLFGLQHSVMARTSFKRWLTRFVPTRLERSTFVLLSSLTLALLMWQWRPLGTVLWRIDSPWFAAPLWAINALGWLGVPLVSFMIDHFDLFGLKQPFHAFRRTSYRRGGFVVPLLYRYVRHPMMTSFLLAFWITPHMTLGHLLLASGMSIYIGVGVHFEERSLARDLGQAYARYQAYTPQFLPLGAKQSGKSLAEAARSSNVA